MRWTLWLLAVLGIAQFMFVALAHPVGISMDMAYLIMALTLIALLGGLALGCGYGCDCNDWGCGCGHCDECRGGGCCGACGCGGCDCQHCDGCKTDACCGKCDCAKPAATQAKL